MDLDIELKCSFLGGMVEVKGSAEYLDSREVKKNEVSVVMSYKAVSLTSCGL